MREAAVDAVAELAQPEDPVAVSKVGQGVPTRFLKIDFNFCYLESEYLAEIITSILGFQIPWRFNVQGLGGFGLGGFRVWEVSGLGV